MTRMVMRRRLVGRGGGRSVPKWTACPTIFSALEVEDVEIGTHGIRSWLSDLGKAPCTMRRPRAQQLGATVQTLHGGARFSPDVWQSSFFVTVVRWRLQQRTSPFPFSR